MSERKIDAPVIGGAVVDAADGAPQPAPRAADGEKIALIIGVSDYSDGGVPDLRFARPDAEAVYARFVDGAGLGCAPRNVRLLLDREATRADLRQAILWLNEVARPIDTVVFYFAGHGAVGFSPGGEMLGTYLVPHDARTVEQEGRTRLDPATGISIAEIQRTLQVNRARNMLVIFDACFAGGTEESLSREVLDPRGAARSEAEFEALRDAGSGRVVLTATTVNQPALESKRLAGGLFTRYLLEGLDADGNRDGQVTVQEAYDHLFPRVRDEARAAGREQTPTKRESLTGTFKLRDMPGAHAGLGLEVRYGPDGPATLQGQARAPAWPQPVVDARRYSATVTSWRSRVPLHAYLLRISRTAAGTRSQRLVPDGETAHAPLATVSDRRTHTFPAERETGTSLADVPAAERDAHVLFVLAAAVEPIDPAALDRIERRLATEATAGPPDEMARRCAAALEADPALRPAALRFGFVQHGRGAPGARKP